MWVIAVACARTPCGPEGVRAEISAPDPAAAKAALEARLTAWGAACTEVTLMNGGVEVWLPAMRPENVPELVAPNRLAFLPVVEGGTPLVEQTPSGPHTWTVDRGQDLRPIVVSAKASSTSDGLRQTSITLDDASGARFGRWTQGHVGEVLVVALDDEVLMAPIIREPILGGSLAIWGRPDVSDRLRAPPVPDGLVVRSVQVVGPASAAP